MKRRYSLTLKRISYVTFFSLCLCSCSVQKQRAEFIEAPNLDVALKESFLSKDFTPGAWCTEKWWEIFEDPQLSDFIETSIQKSPTLQAATERVLSAHQVTKLKFSPLLPEVDLAVKDALASIHYQRQGIEIDEPLLPNSILPNWINFFASLVNFKWKLDIWGKQKKLFQAALDETQMEMAQAAQKKLLLSVQVAQSYFDLQYQMRMNQLLNQTLDFQMKKLNLLQMQKQCGLATTMQIEQLKELIYQSQTKQIATQESLTKDLNQLSSFVALDPTAPLGVQMPQAHFNQPFPMPENVSIDLLSKRPDIVSKIWLIQAAIKRVNVAKIDFLPSIDLSSLSGYFTLTYPEIMKPRAWFTSILPGATLPIFHGLALRSKLNYALRQYNILVNEYNETLVQATQEVVDSITAFKFSQKRIDKQQDMLGALQNLSMLSTMRYQNGLNTSMQVIDTEINLINAQMQYAQWIQLRLLSTLNLIKSLGGGYENTQAQENMNQEFIYE